MSSPPKKSFTVSFFLLLVFSLRTSVCLSAHISTKEESKHFSTLGGMGDGWLRDGQGRPSGNTVLIVANAGPTVRARVYIYIYIYIYFWERLYPSSSSSVAVMVFLLSFAMFSFCFGSLEIITGVSRLRKLVVVRKLFFRR